MKGGVTKIRYKIVFLGDQNVGKTALINRFINNTFDQSYNVLVSCRRLLLALIFL
jgi:GTPase SAR1 family protein